MEDKLRWYTYCSLIPFDRDLASLMKRAGCAGINFGVDSLCDEQLSRLGRGHSTSDIQRLIALLKEAGLKYMFDLLIGGPGETGETVRASVDKVRQLNIPLAGIAADTTEHLSRMFIAHLLTLLSSLSLTPPPSELS